MIKKRIVIDFCVEKDLSNEELNILFEEIRSVIKYQKRNNINNDFSIVIGYVNPV